MAHLILDWQHYEFIKKLAHNPFLKESLTSSERNELQALQENLAECQPYGVCFNHLVSESDIKEEGLEFSPEKLPLFLDNVASFLEYQEVEIPVAIDAALDEWNDAE
jgi:hypothetical protein